MVYMEDEENHDDDNQAVADVAENRQGLRHRRFEERPRVVVPQEPLLLPQHQRPRRIPWCKLLAIGCLAGLCLLLQLTLWTMVWMKQHDMLEFSFIPDSMITNQLKGDTDSMVMQSESSLNAPSNAETAKQQHAPLNERDLHLHRLRNSAYSTTSSSVERDSHWKQAVSILLVDWDPLVEDDLIMLGAASSSSSGSKTSQTASSARLMRTVGNETALEFGIRALQQAADLGHAEAQTTLAHVYSTGIWPTPVQPSKQRLHAQDESDASPLSSLTVQDSLIQDNPQQTQALLLYRMAAMSGHPEAIMAMAHRLEVVHAAHVGTNNEQSSRQESHQQCLERLPYYRASADAIIDQLETNVHSRTKILPPTEKHVLYQIHLVGGSGSKLDAYNHADESNQAIQYYQVRAHAGESPHAAFTLANLHHYGLRGVEQNVSTALQYYSQAAKQEHWEAAGLAAMFYFWGIGTSDGLPDRYAAHRYVQLGMPWDLAGCRRQMERKLKAASQPKQQQGDTPNLSLCDGNALNVMGLLLLFGLNMIVSQNAELAQGYFQLAKEQGNRDAAYNLAMTRLGWQTHFKSLDDLDELGQTTVGDFGTVMSDANRWKHGLTQSEMQTIVADLTTAAGATHVQAKHRLGMMYSEGVRIPHKAGFAQVVPKDCDKALKHFRWISDNASPQKSARLRRAYKQYASGDTAGSLRNYLVAAETGSDLAQLNAAFLMEQGECLGMNRIDCAKASVRLWKAGANRGQAEASLRVGDFYYYGRLRQEGMSGPSVWIQYLLYPEKHLSKLWSFIRMSVFGSKSAPVSSLEDDEKQVCRANEDAGTCLATNIESQEQEHTVQKDMEMAVYFYRLAAERAASPRANYNLGFMYQFGVGVKQDFHLAKRHYDLAVASQSREADLPVYVALVVMRIHEELVKLWMTKETWLPRGLFDGDSDMTAA